MPTFLGLAAELQLLIISEIHLNDIEEFALCCKVVHQLSEKRLMEQYARKRYFSTIAVGHINTLTWDEDPQIRGVHPLSILRDLLADSQTWLYTETLIIGCIEDYVEGGFEQTEEAELDEVDLQDTVAQLKRNTPLLKKVLEVQQYIYPERSEINLENCPETKQWTKAILSGSKEAAASLLIAMLPNLQKVRLVDRLQWPVESIFLSSLDNLLRAAVSNKHSLTGSNSFSKLTEVGMHGIEEHAGADYEVFKGFMLLPSMTTIKGRVIDGACLEPFPEGFIGFSKVTSLEFYQSAIDAASFSGTLCAIRGLQKFIYDFWAHTSVDPQVWEPHQIIGALKVHARKTLAHLELTGRPFTEDPEVGDCAYNEGEPFIGSLCVFEALKTIRLETMMLYKEVEGADCLTQEENNLGPSSMKLRELGRRWREDQMSSSSQSVLWISYQRRHAD